MKLYISMPMKGKSQERIIVDRNIAIAKAIEVLGLRPDMSDGNCEYNGGHIEVIDQIHPDHKNLHPLACLGYSLEKMAEADVVFFAEGWNQARGCQIELQCACSYGKRVITA